MVKDWSESGSSTCRKGQPKRWHEKTRRNSPSHSWTSKPPIVKKRQTTRFSGRDNKSTHIFMWSKERFMIPPPHLQSTLLPLIAAPPRALSLGVEAIRMNLPARVFDPPTCGWNFPRVTLSSGHLLFWPSATFASSVAKAVKAAFARRLNRED